MDMSPQLHASRGLIFGAFFQALGIFLRLHGSVRPLIIGSVVAMVLATIIFVRGCMHLAEWRDRSPWMGLLGLITVLGVAKLSLPILLGCVVLALAVLWFWPAPAKLSVPS